MISVYKSSIVQRVLLPHLFWFKYRLSPNVCAGSLTPRVVVLKLVCVYTGCPVLVFSTYFFKTGLLTEPRARLAVSKPRSFSTFHSTGVPGA